MFTIANSIKNAREKIKHLQNDGYAPSIGDIWSIKKVILLDYYMPEFKIICSPKNKFSQWFYADPFCGSGLFSFEDKDLQNEYFPGSALMGAINGSEIGYTDCIFSENDEKNIESLNHRLKNSKHILKNRTFIAKKLDFEHGVDEILKIKKFGVAILVLIDPAGYVPVKWTLMEKLLNEVGIDIILNFYTHRIAQNVSASKQNKGAETNLDDFFGDSNWKNYRVGITKKNLGQKLLQYYLNKVTRISGKTAISIGVNKEGKNRLYDLIVITRSPAGAKVIQYGKKSWMMLQLNLLKENSKYRQVNR